MEKALKYDLWTCEVEAMAKIVEDLEEASRRHNSKILYWHGSSQSGPVPINDRNGAVISYMERVREMGRKF